MRTTTRDQPLIRRISLAVLVDQVPIKDANGNIAWQDRTADELNRITALARSAVGLDEKRGDRVEVVSLRFVDADAPADPARPGLFGLPVDKSDVMRIGQTAVLAIVAVLALLLVLRPMVVRLTTAPVALADESAAGAASPGPDGIVAGGGAGVPGTPGRPAALAIAGPDGSGQDESMVQIGNIEGAIRASSLRHVAGLVEKSPEESLAVMRGWMAKEGA